MNHVAKSRAPGGQRFLDTSLSWAADVIAELSDDALNDALRIDAFFISRRTEEEVAHHCREAYSQLLRVRAIPYTTDLASHSTICVQSLERPDYSRLFGEIRTATCGLEVPLFKPAVDLEGGPVPERVLQLATLVPGLLQRIRLHSGVNERNYLALRALTHIVSVSPVLFTAPRYAIFFASMQPAESLLCHWFNGRGVTTVTAQHGLYLDYTDMDTVNVVNYEVQPAQHFLAWGPDTAELIRAYHPAVNTHICGKPHLAFGIDLSDFRDREVPLLHVILDQEAFRLQNLELLRVVEGLRQERKYHIYIRFHPHNNITSYKKLFPWVEAVPSGEVADVYLGITSSLLHELERAGATVLQYVTDLPCHNLGDEVRFTDLMGLLACLRLGSNRVGGSERHIALYGDEALSAYRKVWRQLTSALPALESHGPLLSIIVPVFNGQREIRALWDSIRQQSFSDYEVIFCDGGSSDLSVQMITHIASEDQRVRLVFERDRGIYDGMNNGLWAATGRWVYFMGCDDRLRDESSLQTVMCDEASFRELGMIYGSVQVVGDVKWAPDGTVYDGEFDTEKIQRKNICHQAIFYNRACLEAIQGYSLKYPICADWDANIKVFARYGAAFVDVIVANFYAGGASTDGSDSAFGKDFKALCQQEFGENCVFRH